NRSPTENLRAVAAAKRTSVGDITAVILDRDRHKDLIAEVRQAGARIRLITDGDVAGAISTAWQESGVDILFGIGGTPEGVTAASTPATASRSCGSSARSPSTSWGPLPEVPLHPHEIATPAPVTERAHARPTAHAVEALGPPAGRSAQAAQGAALLGRQRLDRG